MTEQRSFTQATVTALRSGVCAAGGLAGRVLAAVDSLQAGRTWLAFPFAVVRKFADDQAGQLAVLVAYYGFLSLFPLLLVFASILGFVLGGSPPLQHRVLATAEESFPALSGYLGSKISASNAALGVGLAGTLWGGLGVATATENAMNTVWDIPMSKRPNFWVSRLRGVGMLAILGATFVVSSGLSALLSVGAFGVLGTAAEIVGPLVLNFALYLVAFQVLTNEHLAWRTMVPGAAIGAVGWTVMADLGSYYTRHVILHASDLYGSLAVVVGLLAWMYLGAQLTLYAAEVNVVLHARLWPRSLTGGPRTEADRRAVVRQARRGARAASARVTVEWEKEQGAC